MTIYYYQFNIGDYRKDTAHLSLLEHGIYRQLIDTYYTKEGKLEADMDLLMRTHCIRSPDEVRAFENVIKDFFVEQDGMLTHRGCDKVISEIYEKSDKAKASARARWDKENANAKQTECERNADGMLSNNQEPITNNQEPVTNNQEPDLKHKVSKDTLSGSIPTCPHQDIVSLFHEVLPELPEVRIWNPTRQGYLKARWRETALEEKWETQEQGIAWFKKFFAWIRHSKFLMGKVPPNRGGRPFECELEWILKPNNWTKILEGKYHAS